MATKILGQCQLREKGLHRQSRYTKKHKVQKRSTLDMAGSLRQFEDFSWLVKRQGSPSVAVSVLQNQWKAQGLKSFQIKGRSMREGHWS